ncbi:hypothetical protein ACSBR1_029499 [Camellia fascicularis]
MSSSLFFFFFFYLSPSRSHSLAAPTALVVALLLSPCPLFFFSPSISHSADCTGSGAAPCCYGTIRWIGPSSITNWQWMKRSWGASEDYILNF